MFETSTEIPAIHRLADRDGRRDRPTASLACLLGLCAALMALVFVPKSSAGAEPAQAVNQQAENPLFP